MEYVTVGNGSGSNVDFVTQQRMPKLQRKPITSFADDRKTGKKALDLSSILETSQMNEIGSVGLLADALLPAIILIIKQQAGLKAPKVVGEAPDSSLPVRAMNLKGNKTKRYFKTLMLFCY